MFRWNSLKASSELLAVPEIALVPPTSTVKPSSGHGFEELPITGTDGPWGWLEFDLDERIDWDEVAELDASYRLTAPKRSVQLLDEHAANG